jgi:putative flippase GtrA
VAGARQWLRRNANARFVRFMGVSAVALATSLLVLGICDGVLHFTSVPAALLSQIGGALVSYVLSRWAWERKGKPDVLRETIPFWIVFGVATVISTLATKLGYVMARWLHLQGFKQVMFVEIIYLAANVATFLMRFVIFHYILFADRTAAAGDVAIEDAAIAAADPLTATQSLSPAEAHEPAVAHAETPAPAALHIAALATSAD